MGRFSLALKSFFGILSNGKLPDEVMAELGVIRRIAAPPVASAASTAQAAGPADGAIQILGILQRDARLLDFIYEDISAYTDQQVGSAIRDVHDQCRKALDRVLTLGPVIDGVEGTSTRLAAAGLSAKDTAKLKLLGNLKPGVEVEAGLLQSKGWQVTRLQLPAPDAAVRARILAPAEIEVE